MLLKFEVVSWTLPYERILPKSRSCMPRNRYLLYCLLLSGMVQTADMRGAQSVSMCLPNFLFFFSTGHTASSLVGTFLVTSYLIH